ncbi:hypothetical protein AB0H77_22110 [Streptomyces sp. NPDC050844]|uniref:hypothetical protein n=1 Tax=Streptomyces sp. NPDC050844 TaxID=3155790 RepID=UPI0033D42216
MLKNAHNRVRALNAPESVRTALTRTLLVITAAAKHDPADATRRLERLMKDLDENRLPNNG